MIKRYKDNGRLEDFKIERAQIAKYVHSAFQDLEEAKKTYSVSDKAAYFFAYTAMLKIGRALIFLKGFRPKGKGQHETVVSVAGSLLGSGYKSLTDRFERMRRKRNKLIYDIGGLVSHTEAEEAFKAAGEYLEHVRIIMQKEDPQLKLNI